MWTLIFLKMSIPIEPSLITHIMVTNRCDAYNVSASSSRFLVTKDISTSKHVTGLQRGLHCLSSDIVSEDLKMAFIGAQ